jgi:threonine dehydrogenase-like Zn-dependent dehydrogenase
VAIDHAAHRRLIAKRYGAASHASVDGLEPAADVVIVDALADEPAVRASLRLLRPGGTLVLGEPGVASVKSMQLLTGASVREAPWPDLERLEELVLAIEQREVDLSPIVSHVMPLEEAGAAYRLVAEATPGTLGVLLKP